MIASAQLEQDLLNTLVERYSREGYEVIKEPAPNDVPFDLGGYKPDLIALKEGRNIIIEVKAKAERISFDTLRSVADEVKRHDGWRFFLVTGQDVDDSHLPGQMEESFSWDEVSEPLKDAATSVTQRAQILAFMGLWVAFERMVRFQSRRISLPVDRLTSPRTMIDQLYSLGEFSAQQFETALDLVPVRNQIFHGVDTSNLGNHLKRLQALVHELQDEWSGPANEIAKQ